MSQKTYGIDFGTGTIKVYKKGQGIILLERNVVATVGSGKRPVAIGEKAYEMYEKAPPSINVTFPLSHGVISELKDMTALWNFMLSALAGHKKFKGGEFYIAVPADITEVEKKAYSQIISEGEGKPRHIFLVDKPVADAYGLGIDVAKTHGSLIVNIGADTTEISIISLGGIVFTKLLPDGSLKIAGRDILKGLPGEISLSSKEIYPLVEDVFYIISSSVKSMLERTPPEISQEIIHTGLYLTGASSWIKGIDALIEKETHIKANTTKNAQKTVAEGLGYLAGHPKTAASYLSRLK